MNATALMLRQPVLPPGRVDGSPRLPEACRGGRAPSFPPCEGPGPRLPCRTSPRHGIKTGSHRVHVTSHWILFAATPWGSGCWSEGQEGPSRGVVRAAPSSPAPALCEPTLVPASLPTTERCGRRAPKTPGTGNCEHHSFQPRKGVWVKQTGNCPSPACPASDNGEGESG